MKKINKPVRSIFIVFGLICLLIFSRLIYLSIDDDVTVSKIPIVEYSNLFNVNAQNKLALIVSTKSKYREPSSSYIYDNRFNVFVYKILTTNWVGFSKNLDVKNESSFQHLSTAYASLPAFNFNMKIKQEKSITATSIHFKYSGDFIKTIIQNDSLLNYYFRFNTFSINYNNDSYDIIAKANDSNISASVAFINKGKNLYVVLMTIAKENGEMQPDQLYNLLNK